MSLVREIADRLIALSLDASPGDHLGGEDDLLRKLGVSRPTLRQAAKIVEADRLLQVRSGARGGFYATRPTVGDAIHAPARYLRLNGATIANLQVMTRPIVEEVVALCALSTDDVARQKLEELGARVATADTQQALFHLDADIVRLLGRMSGNPAGELFLEIAYDFGRDEREVRFYEKAEDRAIDRALLAKLVAAILGRDPDIARLMMRRRTDMFQTWLRRDQAAKQSSD